MNDYKTVLNFYMWFGIVAVVLFLGITIYTKNFKKNKIKVLGLFLNLSKIDCVLMSTIVLNIMMTIYCVFNIDKFTSVFRIMFIINSVIAMIFSMNFHLIITELLYSSINIVVLTLLSLVNTFLTSVNYDEMTYILSIIFSCAVVVYSFFCGIRKIEITLKKNKFVRRNI